MHFKREILLSDYKCKVRSSRHNAGLKKCSAFSGVITLDTSSLLTVILTVLMIYKKLKWSIFMNSKLISTLIIVTAIFCIMCPAQADGQIKITALGDGSYFFECPFYNERRELLFNSLNWLPVGFHLDLGLPMFWF